MTYLKKPFGYFLFITHESTGAAAPIRKKNNRAIMRSVEQNHVALDAHDVTDGFKEIFSKLSVTDCEHDILIGLTLGEL